MTKPCPYCHQKRDRQRVERKIMNPELMRAHGFGEYVDQWEQGNCPVCRKPVKLEDFNDPLSIKEFGVTGICQFCQDELEKYLDD